MERAGMLSTEIKMFWREVKQPRKGEQRNEMVMDVNGNILRDGV